MKIGYISLIIAGVITVFTFTGCAQVLGIKSYKTAGGTEIQFTTGFGFGAQMNQYDTVEDTRGIKPGVGYVSH